MSDIKVAIDTTFRDSYPLVVANLSRQVRDIDLAEELCVGSRGRAHRDEWTRA